MYAQCLARIQSQNDLDRAQAQQVLCWLVYSRRVLKLDEFQAAIAIRPGRGSIDKDDMVSVEILCGICAGLVVFDYESNDMRLVHETTRDYFERLWQAEIHDCHELIASNCLAYLSLDRFRNGQCQNEDEFRNRLRDHALLSYASKYWGEHVRLADKPTVTEMAMVFLEDETLVADAMQAFADKFDYSGKALHYAAIFQLDHTIPALIGDSANLEALDSEDRTPLMLAAKYGRYSTVQMLLNEGCFVDSRPSLAEVRDGYTALVEACHIGNEDIVKLLVENGADLEAGLSLPSEPPNFLEFFIHNSRTLRDTGTPLNMATRHGHRNVAEYLVAQGSDVNASGRDNYNPPLLNAVENNDKQMMEILLLHGADLSKRNYLTYTTPIIMAISKGYSDLVRFILERDASLANRDGYIFPLNIAASTGRNDIIAILSEFEVNVHESHDHIGGPLSVAASHSHLATLKILLDLGIDINQTSRAYGTALHAACEKHHIDILQFLLGAGADPNLPYEFEDQAAYDFTYSFPLLAAIRSKGEHGLFSSNEMDENLDPTREKMVKMLLAYGAAKSINYVSHRFGTPLIAAINSRQQKIVAILLAAGASTNIRAPKPWYYGDIGPRGTTAMHVACSCGNLEAVQLFLQHGVTPSDRNGTGMPPLVIAARYGHEAIVKLLLGKGANVNSTAELYSAYAGMRRTFQGTALEAARKYEHPGVQRLLLERIVADHERSKRKS